MTLPAVVQMIREGVPLDDLQATAAKLWLDYGGDAMDDGGKVRAAVEAYWRSKRGSDPYWDFLEQRSSCNRCGETYKYENLSICPNCFNTYCYRHNAQCSCGHKPLG
jgi:hypothetical protein